MPTVSLSAVPQPAVWHDLSSVTLSDETLRERHSKVLDRMRQQELDTLVVYADKEHGGNFSTSPVLFPVSKKHC